MTGAWIPGKGPSSALFLIADTRPLVLRAVGSNRNYSQDVPDYGCLSLQVPYILSFSLFMILAGLTLPRSSGVSEVHVTVRTLN
jgi:NADH:ubiquinone oxidoreductase subunit 4 (subunit M)